MTRVRVAAATLNQIPLDWSGNRGRICAVLAEAKRRAVDLVCLPEMSVGGYGIEDAFLSPEVVETIWDMVASLLPETRGMAVSFGVPVRVQNGLFNAAALAVDGALVAIVPKQNLAGDGVHYEPRWFNAWPAETTARVKVCGVEVPVGDLICDLGGVAIGFEICEDAWVAERPGARLARRGADIILNPSASHFAFGKRAIRERLVVEGARAFNASYIYANLSGNEAGRIVYDGGGMIASAGVLLAEGPRLEFGAFGLVDALIDTDLTRMSQARTHSFIPEVSRPELRVHIPFDWEKRAPTRGPASRPELPVDWSAGPTGREEEFTRAVTLGLFDYLRKSKSRGFVVSLSGGADSAAVACLSAGALTRAWAALGREGVLEALGHIPEIATCATPQELVGRLLTTVYQSTRHSGDVTRNAARGLAEALGAEHHEIDVDALVMGYRALTEQALGRSLSWETDDIALQNIQARVRSPSVWMLANIKGALLLSTSNRSEAAVGYATMDGDTSGGLAPIAGIDKAFLRRWLRWLETVGPMDGAPIPALAAINIQAPTAELRPPAEGQTDEGDLMPYPVLDAIERSAIRDKKLPVAVFEEMRAAFPAYKTAEMGAWVVRFFQLWCRNQWKRERYAPSFHLDDENLDPKTWCRFPILSGGFDMELAELRRTLDALAEADS